MSAPLAQVLGFVCLDRIFSQLSRSCPCAAGRSTEGSDSISKAVLTPSTLDWSFFRSLATFPTSCSLLCPLTY